jgi:hypothetical protein
MENIALNPSYFEADDFDVSEYFVARSVPHGWMVVEDDHVRSQITSYLVEPEEDDGMTLNGF